MFKHYLATALRYFGRNKFTTSVNLFCLVLGLSCFAAAYGLVAWFSNADRHFANSDRIFYISEGFVPHGSDATMGTSPLPSWVLGKLLRAELPQLPAIARLKPRGETPVSITPDNNVFAGVSFADPQFLSIFDLPFSAGDSRLALNSPRTAVVTQRFAQRVFGTADVLGKTLAINGRERVTITGVISHFAQPSHFGDRSALMPSFEILCSMDTYEALVIAASGEFGLAEAQAWASNMGVGTYVLTPADGSVTQSTLNMWLDAFTERHAPKNEGTFKVTADPIHTLQPKLINQFIGASQTGITGAGIILTLGCLILLVSCINYANLSTAQASTRAKEVAMRRVVGANRAEVVRQYLFETALLTLAALVMVAIIAMAGLGILAVKFDVDVGTALVQSRELWLMIVATLGVVTLAAGAYPAWVLSRVRPIEALRGGRGIATRFGFLPKLLVGVQFATSSFLLIAVLALQSQSQQLLAKGLASSGEPIVSITTSTTTAGINMETLRTELLRSSHIESVASYDSVPGSLVPGNRRMVGPTLDPSAERIITHTSAVDYDFFETMRIKLLAGRTFDRSLRDTWDQDTAKPEDVMNVVINRELAAASGWSTPQEAIDKTLYSHAGFGERGITMRVIGVIDSKPLNLIGIGMASFIYTMEPRRATIPVIRLVPGQTQEAMDHIRKTWRALAPTTPLRTQFFDEAFGQSMRILPALNGAFSFLALLAFGISAIGLIGMATHMTQRRMREIGVRKTLGASVTRVLSLLLRDFSKPVVIANVLVWPVAFIVMQGYLSMFMVQTSLGAAPFVLGLLITVGIACASVGVQVTKAARMNPATVLRHE